MRSKRFGWQTNFVSPRLSEVVLTFAQAAQKDSSCVTFSEHYYFYISFTDSSLHIAVPNSLGVWHSECVAANRESAEFRISEYRRPMMCLLRAHSSA